MVSVRSLPFSSFLFLFQKNPPHQVLLLWAHMARNVHLKIWAAQDTGPGVRAVEIFSGPESPGGPALQQVEGTEGWARGASEASGKLSLPLPPKSSQPAAHLCADAPPAKNHVMKNHGVQGRSACLGAEDDGGLRPSSGRGGQHHC